MDKVVVYAGTRNVYDPMYVSLKSLLINNKIDRVYSSSSYKSESNYNGYWETESIDNTPKHLSEIWNWEFLTGL